MIKKAVFRRLFLHIGYPLYRIFIERRIIISKHARALFVHIPKTAGLSVISAIHDQRIDVAGHFLQNPFYRPPKELIKKYKKRPFVFSFVRNPWDRAVSAFFYLNQGGGNICDKWDKHKYIRQYRGDFGRFVREAFPQGRILNQMHFRPQYQWISTASGNLITDFMGKFENLQQDLQQVSALLNIPFDKLPLINESDHDHYRKYYDEESRRIVGEAYRRDIELFEYRF